RSPNSPSQLASALDMAGIAAKVDLVTLGTGLRSWLGGESGQAPIDLLVLTAIGTVEPVLQRALDVPDLVDEAGLVHARFEYASSVGRRDPIPDQQVAFIAGGHVVAV